MLQLLSNFIRLLPFILPAFLEAKTPVNPDLYAALILQVKKETLLETDINFGRKTDTGKLIALGNALASSDAILEELHLSVYRIDRAEIIALLEGISVNKSLKRFSVFYCYDDDVVSLLQSHAQMLKQNRSLTQLGILLSDRVLPAAGMRILATALTENATVTQLRLKTRFDQESVSEVAKMLSENKILTHLDLRNSRISSQEATTIGEALEKNTNLIYLDLSDNCLQTRGIAAVAKMLKMNKTLKSINLRNIGMEEKGALLLAEAIKENSGLTEIKFGESGKINRIGKGLNAIQEVLKAKAIISK